MSRGLGDVYKRQVNSCVNFAVGILYKSITAIPECLSLIHI
ncbi:hypothetical protein JMUB7531_28860 [Staphylococcus aureus]